jgi:hypothetical protein
MPTETPSADPIPEAVEERKKPKRFWLFAPFVLLALAAVAYGGWWAVASNRLGATIDARAGALREAGYVVELSGRRISGFPFRMKLAFSEARIASPSGWALAVPGLAAEAYLHDLGHWVLVAPQGLTFVRPQGGAVAVRGQSLRASIAGVNAAPWRVVMQGRKAVLTPAPGARPFSLAGAELIELYLRPSPQPGEGMVLFRIEGGKAQPGSLLGRIAGEGAVTAALEGRLTKVATFGGADWGQAVRAWSRSGGVLNNVGGTAAAGGFAVKAAGGTLGVGTDGRLVGAVPLELRQAGRALTALADTKALDPAAAGSAAAVAAARAQGEAATVNLVFQAGVTTFGPVKVGPSPSVG